MGTRTLVQRPAYAELEFKACESLMVDLSVDGNGCKSLMDFLVTSNCTIYDGC